MVATRTPTQAQLEITLNGLSKSGQAAATIDDSATADDYNFDELSGCTSLRIERWIPASQTLPGLINISDASGDNLLLTIPVMQGIKKSLNIGSTVNNPQGGFTITTSDLTMSGLLIVTPLSYVTSYQDVSPPQGPPLDDFSVGVNPGGASIVPSQSAQFTVTTTSLFGFSKSVSLTASPAIAGVSYSFAPPTIASDASSILTVSTTGAVAPGSYTITVTATGGSLVHTVPIGLTVNAVSTPDFSLSATPSNKVVQAGQSAVFTITNTAFAGYTGTPTLTAGPTITGVSYGFVPNPIAAGGTSTLTVTTTTAATTGQHSITVTGTDGALVHTAPISLSISPVGGDTGTAQIQMRNPTSVANDRVTMKAYIRCPDYTPYVVFDYRAVGTSSWTSATPIGRPCHYRWANYYMEVKGLTAATDYEYRVRVLDIATSTLVNNSENLTSGATVIPFTTRPAADVSQWNNRNITSGNTMIAYALPGDPTSGEISLTNEAQFTSIAQRLGGTSVFDIVVYGTNNPSGKTPGTVELYDQTGLVTTKSYAQHWLRNAITTDAKIGSVIGLEGFDGLAATYSAAVLSALTAAGHVPLYDGGGTGVTGASWSLCIGGDGTSSANDATWGGTCVTGLRIVGADMTQPSKLATLSTAASPNAVAGEPVLFVQFGSAGGGCNNIVFKNIKLMSVPGNTARIPSSGSSPDSIDTGTAQFVGVVEAYDCEVRAFRENFQAISVSGYSNDQGWGTKSHFRMFGNSAFGMRRCRMSWTLEHGPYMEGIGTDLSGVRDCVFDTVTDFSGIRGTLDPTWGFTSTAFQLTTRASPDSFKLKTPSVIRQIHQLFSPSLSQQNNYIDGAPSRCRVIIKNTTLNGQLTGTGQNKTGSFPFAVYGQLGEIIVDNVHVGRGAGFGVMCDTGKGHYMVQGADGFWYAHGRLHIKSLTYDSNVSYLVAALMFSSVYDVQIDAIAAGPYTTGTNGAFIAHYNTGQSGKNGNSDTNWPVDDGPILGECGKVKLGFGSAYAGWTGGTFGSGDFTFRFQFGDEVDYVAAQADKFNGAYVTRGNFYNPP